MKHKLYKIKKIFPLPSVISYLLYHCNLDVQQEYNSEVHVKAIDNEVFFE